MAAACECRLLHTRGNCARQVLPLIRHKRAAATFGTSHRHEVRRLKARLRAQHAQLGGSNISVTNGSTDSAKRSKHRAENGVAPGGVITEFVAETLLPTRHGKFRLRGYRHSTNGRTFSEPSAIIAGSVEGQEGVPLRVHDACFTSEVLGSLKCDCAEQLQLALEYVRDNAPGLVIYLQQEGRGIGLANKIAAYALQEEGLDTVDANRALGLPDDCREYTAVYNILSDLNIKSVQLLTNNPRKIQLLRDLGVAVVGRVPCIVSAGSFNRGYLQAKEQRMEHMLDGSWCYWNHDGREPLSQSPLPPDTTVAEDARL